MVRTIGDFIAAALTTPEAQKEKSKKDELIEKEITDPSPTHSNEPEPQNEETPSEVPDTSNIVLSDPELVVEKQPRTPRSLEVVYVESVSFLREIATTTRTQVRRVIRRVNKLKNYSKTQEDIGEQREILKKRCDKSVARLTKLETDRDKAQSAVKRLRDERDHVT